MSVKLMGMVFDADIKPITIQTFGGKQKTVQASTLKSVLLAMSNASNDDGKGSYRSLTTLEKNTGLARSAVVFALRALVQKKYLLRVGMSEVGTTNYTINVLVLAEDYTSPQRGLGQSSARTSTSPQRGLNSSFNHPLPERMITQAVKDYCAAFKTATATVTALQAQKINAAHDHNPANWPDVIAWAARSDVSAPGRILSAAIKWQPQRSNGNGTSTWRNSNHATGGAGVRHPGGSSNAPTPAEVERDRELAKRKRANRVR